MDTVRNDQHCVRQPKIIFFLRIAHVLAATAVLGLSAYCLDYITKYDNLFSFIPSEVEDTKTAFGFAVFAFAYTTIAFVYLEISARWYVVAWNCWAALALYIGGVIFWLVSFALLAAWAQDKEELLNNDYGSLYTGEYSSLGSFDLDSFGLGSFMDDFFRLRKRYIATSDAEEAAIRSPITWKCGAAAAGVGALAWILMVAILIVYSISLHTHRRHPENQDLPANGRPMTLAASTQPQQEAKEVQHAPPQTV